MTTMTTSPATQLVNAELMPQMMQMLSGYWVSQSLYVVAKLKIADLLGDGQKSYETLAQEANAQPDALYRILRALAGLGVFEEIGEKQFRNTKLSSLLRADLPNSMLGIAEMMGNEHYRAWDHLLESTKTGAHAFESMFNMPVFKYFETNPEAGEIFNRAMSGFASTTHLAVASAYDFSKFKTIADIGGGHGKLLSTLMTQFPNLNGILFDLPHVVSGATDVKAKLGKRIELVSGNFFESVTPVADAYILSHIIHDWRDDLSLKILKNIHATMPDDATLLLVEHVIETNNQPSPAKFLDINMLVMTEGGRERTAEEYRELYAAAGFTLTNIYPSASGISVIEGKKI